MTTSVPRVRRLLVFALTTAVASAAALGIAIAPASAHICPIAVQIPVGQLSSIDVGVTVEGATVTDVEIGIPPGLQLDRVDPKPGWTIARSGATVRYRGGVIAQYTCEYFSLGVTAPAKGSFGITVVQRTADGTIVANAVPDPTSASDRILDQFVYAGVKPPPPPSSSSGPSTTTIAGIALVGFGVLMIGLIRIRAWYQDRQDYEDDEGDADDGADPSTGDDREAELRARLERFKKRTPDPPARR